MKRLLIDLDICSKCEECGMLCSYIQHPGNNGITTLREFAHFAVVCRHCDDAPCVASCPWKALEPGPTNILKRHMMRCTSCKNCSRACPFGVIYPETIPFVISRCDYCIGRLKDGDVPICLQSCACGGIQYGEFDTSTKLSIDPEPGRRVEEKTEDEMFVASDHLIVRTAFKWSQTITL